MLRHRPPCSGARERREETSVQSLAHRAPNSGPGAQWWVVEEGVRKMGAGFPSNADLVLGQNVRQAGAGT